MTDPSLTPSFTSNVLLAAAQRLPPQDRAAFLAGASAGLRLAAEKHLAPSQLERTAAVLFIQAAAAREHERATNAA
jgi:hypothetical protein